MMSKELQLKRKQVIERYGRNIVMIDSFSDTNI